MGNQKYNLKFCQKYYNEHNCELLENEYKNSEFPMKFKCHCGNISTKSFYHFRQVHRCASCGKKEIAKKKRHSYDYVYNFFKENDCELLTKEYKNAFEKLEFKCKCNTINNVCFNNFEREFRCQNCANEKLRKERQHPYEFVFHYFKINNCELLENKYINANIPLRYKCECSNISKISFASFKSGTRCMKCSHKRHVKNSKRFRDYKLPSGKIIRIQGYEDVALDDLLKTYNETHIFTSRNDMPNIKYLFKKKLRSYYPDIWIPSKNLLIEIKSIYTYRIDLIRNILKALAVRKLEINYEIWIYSKQRIVFKL